MHRLFFVPLLLSTTAAIAQPTPVLVISVWLALQP